MPEQYHSKSFDNENRIKKQIVRFLDNNAPDVVLRGTTVKDSKSYNDVIQVCEEIETISEIAIKDLELFVDSQIRGIYGNLKKDEFDKLYVLLKKGLKLLKGLNLKGYPAGDIETLNKYTVSLDNLLEALHDLDKKIEEDLMIPYAREEKKLKYRGVTEVKAQLDNILTLYDDFLTSLERGLKIHSSGTSEEIFEGGYSLHKGAPHYLPQRFL
jgi:hypothetical protein